MAKESLEQKRKRTKKIIIALKKTHPDARLALNFANPLQLLIALILAAQARDDLVNEVTAELFPKYPTATDWANEKEEVLQQHLRKINFYRKKTRSIQKACRVLVERFGRQVPDQLDDLLTVPGVGRKTANIILGNAFGRPAIGVDTHVARLSQRLGLTRGGCEPPATRIARNARSTGSVRGRRKRTRNENRPSLAAKVMIQNGPLRIFTSPS